MQQKLSLGSNVVDWVRSLWKHPTRLCGTNFCINCISLSHFAPSFGAAAKWSQMHPNTMKRNKRWVWGPMGSIGCLNCENIRRHFVARTFALIAPVQPILHRVSCSNKMVPIAPKHYEMHQNMSLGSDGVDRVDLLQKTLMQLCGLNFCINFNSSVRFEPSIVKQRYVPKCSQTLRNKTKHGFMVQWEWIGCIRCE